jgi:tRNA A37 threonylcarbamoyladenosine synthetase subunit TsaC/SUA5/YrdC
MTTTLQLPDEGLPESDPELIRDRIGRQVDLIIDGGACGLEPTTIIDLTAAPPVLVRAGLGPFP